MKFCSVFGHSWGSITCPHGLLLTDPEPAGPSSLNLLFNKAKSDKTHPRDDSFFSKNKLCLTTYISESSTELRPKVIWRNKYDKVKLKYFGVVTAFLEVIGTKSNSDEMMNGSWTQWLRHTPGTEHEPLPLVLETVSCNSPAGPSPALTHLTAKPHRLERLKSP